MNTTEKDKLDRELEAFKDICAALMKVDEADQPRILGAVAILHGIEKFPTVSFQSRPR